MTCLLYNKCSKCTTTSTCYAAATSTCLLHLLCSICSGTPTGRGRDDPESDCGRGIVAPTPTSTVFVAPTLAPCLAFTDLAPSSACPTVSTMLQHNYTKIYCNSPSIPCTPATHLFKFCS